MMERDISDALERLAVEHKAKPADVQADFKRVREQAQAEQMVPGVLSEEELQTSAPYEVLCAAVRDHRTRRHRLRARR